MPTTQVRDLGVYYEIHGSGFPLLLISGTGNDLRTSPAEAMPVNDHFTTIHFDQRGLGQTGKPDRPYTMADYADDAAGLLDALDIEAAHVMGISFGGMVAQHLVARHPHRVTRLVLACTSSGGDGGSSADLLAVSELAADERATVQLRLLDARNDPQNGVLAPGLGPIVERGIAQQAATAEDPEALLGARRQLEARAGHDAWAALGSIRSPTLVIGGRFDGMAPPRNQEAMAGRIPGAELSWADGGHAFLLQDPSSWTTIIEFLNRPS